jgi:hypothetical protein
MAVISPVCSVYEGTTVVIVPLRVLLGDLQRRYEKARISSMIWSSEQPHNIVSNVFVMPASAVTKIFAGL